MSTIQAKDLTKEFPRSPYEKLNGFPWLPRMIDKVRSLNAGTLGEYSPYPCGGDQGFLGAMGLDADALKALITGGASDEEIGNWVKQHAGADAEGKIAAYRQRQFAPTEPPILEYLDGAKADLKAARPELDLSGVDNFAKLIAMEEGYAIPTA